MTSSGNLVPSTFTMSYTILSVLSTLYLIIISLTLTMCLVCLPCCKGRNEIGESSSVSQVKIAVLLPLDDTRLFSIHRVMPAIYIALEKVTQRSILPAHVNLTVNYADSKCHNEAINEAFNFYMAKEVSVYFGPVCDYALAPIARQMKYWDLPVVTAGAMAGDFGRMKIGTFPLLTRVGAHFNSLANFILSAMSQFSWRKVKLIYNADAQHEIIERFCHLAADGLHHALLQQQSKNDSVKHDYFKFIKESDILDALDVEIGNEYAGKFSN